MKYSLSERETQELDVMIRRAAKFVAHDFPGVEYEDVVQDVWVEVCRAKQSPFAFQNPSYILTVLAKSAAWKQRTAHLEATSQYTYRPSDIRTMLETLFEKEEWYRSYVPEDARSLTPNGTDSLDMRSDMSRAFLRLPLNYQNSLLARYRDKKIPAGSSAERRMLDRGVQYLCDVINSQYWTPGRNTINNTAALEMLRDQEDRGRGR